jgi:hypothetical protein
MYSRTQPKLKTSLPVYVECIRSFNAAAQAASVPYVATNDCHCCAERRFIGRLRLEASREGVQRCSFARWVHRKYGDLIVSRTLHDGTPGISFPCVLCRKTLERTSIQWKAHFGPIWFKSTDPDLPKSRPTQRQKHYLGFN